ncbi:MAG: prepilin-type N-terminal cleavage/methylation domain-containing protein [Chitinivibrionales bacterium]|nr:prepilin-type N-terminal cleavage/methylation domain-containing protein [Chitinivibrionales bacterium]
MRRRIIRSDCERCGITLVELMVAIAVSGIIVGVVCTSWVFISRHAAQKKRQTHFRVQTENAARRILSQVRRSQKVLYFDESSIAFLAPGKTDTLRYVYDGEYLRLNGDSLTFLSPSVYITDFHIEKEEEDELTATSDILIRFYFLFEDDEGNLSEIELQTMANYIPEEADEYIMDYW